MDRGKLLAIVQEIKKESLIETDKPRYKGVDSGCAMATEFLRYPSNCQLCPFSECKLDRPWQERRSIIKQERNRLIRRRTRAGVKVDVLSQDYGVSERTIQRALAETKCS